MNKQVIIGKVLWWSDRNENGIILDPKGREFYFDRSVLIIKKNQKLERNSLVSFTPDRCDNFLAASLVKVPLAKSKKRLEKRYEEEKNQLQLPLAI